MIPETYDRLPIGRRIHKILRDGVRENGLVLEAVNLHIGPGCTWTFKVKWTSEQGPADTYCETLALRTLYTYYSEDDTYVDEPFVEERIRVLQKVNWIDRKAPAEGSAEWQTMLNLPVKSCGRAGKLTAKARRPAAAKAGAAAETAPPAAAPASASAQEAHEEEEAGPSEQLETRKRKSMSLVSPARNVVAALNRATGIVFGKANHAADAVKEAPQAIGQRISDALPGSSHKLSSNPAGEATASKANSTREDASDADRSQATSKAGNALAFRTSPRAEAQKKEAENVLANIVRPSRTSKPKSLGASKAKAAVSKAQPGSASKKRARKSSLQKAAQAEPVALDDTDLELDLADDELVAAEQDGADRGGEDAASPPQQQAAGPSADEDEMVELPLGACQKYIPRRVMYNDGDMLVAEYTAPGYVEKGEEFTVESIIAERRKGNSFEYLVKWKGYELDINQWEPRAQLEELEAMDNWERLNGKTPKKKKTTRKKAKR